LLQAVVVVEMVLVILEATQMAEAVAQVVLELLAVLPFQQVLL
jgi:hypothetical protein